MGRWGFWDWTGYSCLGMAAFVEAANTTLSGAPRVSAVLPFMRWEMISYLPLALFVIGSIVLILRASGTLPGKRLAASPAAPVGHYMECDPPQPERIYEGAHEKLMLFIVSKMFPACSARRELTYAILRGLCENGFVAELADLGSRRHSDVSEYNQGLKGLELLSVSPPEFIPFGEMIESVSHVEMGYIDYVKQANRLAQTGYMPPHIVPLITNRYEDWRVAHNAMVTAYEDIKRDSRMGRLFRPTRESRWGGVLQPFTGAVPLPLMLKEPEADKQQ